MVKNPTRPRAIASLLCALSAFSCGSTPKSGTTSESVAQDAGCSDERRREVLRTMQREVLARVPREVASLDVAVRPGGELAGWRLSHGLVVLAGAGGVAVDNVQTKPPMPQLLLYEPSPSSGPEDWLDFDGPDGPYRLIGWAFIMPYEEGSEPPHWACIAAEEWLLHEAGWHTKDGGMRLSPGAAQEPPAPEGLAVHFWHPRIWDLHMWLVGQDVPLLMFGNPSPREGGIPLPAGAFMQWRDGQLVPLEAP